MNEGQTSDYRCCAMNIHVLTEAIFYCVSHVPVKTQISSDKAPDRLWQPSVQLAAVSLCRSFLGLFTRVV